MAKFLMPFEDMPQEELVAPTRATPRMVIPFENSPDPIDQKTAAEKVLTTETPLKRGLIGAGKTFQDTLLGAKQLAGMIGNEKWKKDVIDQLKSEKEAREALSKDPYASAGSMAANIGIGLMNPATRSIPAMAATGALAGALTPQEQPSWGETITEAAIGAGLGGLGGGLTSGLTTGVAKAKNAAMGRFSDPVHANRFRIFKENQVPASLGDITQSPGVMSIENAAQHIPMTGRRDFLEQQAQRLQEVIKEAPENIAGAVPSSTKESLGDTLAKSVKEKYKSVKDTARSMYDDVAQKVQAVNAPPVPPMNLQASAQRLKSDYPTVFDDFQDKKAISRLDDIISGTGPQSSVILNSAGVPIKTPAAISFEDMRWLDKRLGSMIRQGRQQAFQGKMDPEAFNQLTELQKALRADIEAWSGSIGHPDIEKGIRQANQYFRENVVPFRESPLTRDIVQGKNVNIDNLPNRMFRLDSPWLAEQSKGFLTPEGVQAGRYHLIKEAEKKAMNDVVENGIKPGQFLRSSALGETGPKLFNADELGRLSDLQEMVHASRRAGGYAADPSTGNRLLGLTPFLDWKIPFAARAFSATTQSEAPIRYLLADPRLYTGTGALGKVGEEILRKSGTGALEDLPGVMSGQE